MESKKIVIQPSCTLILGCMFAGKTSRLCHELSTLADACEKQKLRVAYITHTKSKERITEAGDKDVTTHSGQFTRLSPKIKSHALDVLSKFDTSTADVIGVDEAQFYNIDIVETVSKWVLVDKKVVYLASLNCYANLSKFGYALDIPIYNDIIRLYAKCMNCMKHGVLKEAGFTFKLTGDKHQTIDIGGSDKYIAVCLPCHLELSAIHQ